MPYFSFRDTANHFFQIIFAILKKMTTFANSNYREKTEKNK